MEIVKTRQRGDSLILTLVVLVVVTLGFLYAMRTVVTDTVVAGNNLQKQKDNQATDLALRIFQQNTLGPYALALQDLAIFAVNQTWYRTVPPGSGAPTPDYWNSCLGNANTAARCAQVILPANLGTAPALPYTALAFVQPTGKTDDCGNKSGLRANFYDVYVHIREVAGATTATSESVFKLCVPS
jgi:type II secretory pathway pseudopilin PulG